jgi:hypothetical protein
VKRPRLRRGAPADEVAPRRRRRTPRPDGPRTIIPGDDHPAATPLARDLDAARERLRRAIPPVADEDA